MSNEAKRAELVGAIPRWYSGYGHFALINALGLLAIAGSLSRLDGLAWWEGLFVPFFFCFANLFEWWVHRGPMHHPTRLLRLLYRRHTLEHHAAFTEDDMALREPRELMLVLFPPWFLPLFLLMTSPIPVLLGWLVSWNLGLLFFASAIAYYLVYEHFHLAHHWPAESWLARRPIVRWVRQHHARHHDPARMTQGNFNVSFPLWDWLLGSTLGEGRGGACTLPAETP